MRFIVYDLEAACWRGRPPGGINEIIEIGAVMVSPVGEVLDSFSKFVRPTVNPILSSFCKQLTSIRQEDVDRAGTFPTVIETFWDWIDIYDHDFRLISWGKYDEEMFRQNCELHKLDTDWLVNHTDLKSEYHVIKGKQRYTGLKNTLRKEGFEFTGTHHRAISDAQNLAKIFIKYVDEWMW